MARITIDSSSDLHNTYVSIDVSAYQNPINEILLREQLQLLMNTFIAEWRKNVKDHKSIQP